MKSSTPLYSLFFILFLVVISCDKTDYNPDEQLISSDTFDQFENISLNTLNSSCSYGSGTWSIWETSGNCTISSIVELEYKFKDLKCYLPYQTPLNCENTEPPTLLYKYKIVRANIGGHASTYTYDRTNILSTYSGFHCMEFNELPPYNYEGPCLLFNDCGENVECITSNFDMDFSQLTLANMASHILNEPAYNLNKDTDNFYSALIRTNFTVGDACYWHEVIFVYRSCVMQNQPGS